ncbi:MAG: DUF1080 domain-containing protein [Acidobacteria bacterium]|nr:DUF1080 domain-containing protein [Acidobacteriota bacterium]
MRTLQLAVLFALVGAAGQAADRGVSLFDGKTLQGWHVAAKPADRDKSFWSVKDGSITCDSRGRRDHDYVWLMTGKEYADFDLALKVRSFRESGGNSGVQVRSRYDEAAGWLDGPQIDVHPPGPFRTGWIYDETRGVRHWISPSLPGSAMEPAQGSQEWKWKHSGEGDGWNDLRIACRGTNIKTWLNGLAVADFNGAGLLDDETHRKHNVGLKGFIALQLHIKDDLYIQYKDIFIRVLR